MFIYEILQKQVLRKPLHKSEPLFKILTLETDSHPKMDFSA